MSDQRTVLDFRAVLAAMPLPCWLLDANLVVVAVSDALLRLTGRSRAELVDRPVSLSFPTNPAQPNAPTEGGPLTDSVARALASGRTDVIPRMRHDIEYPVGSGIYVERWWALTNSPMFDAVGHALVLSTVSDISEAVHGELARRESERREEQLIEHTQRLESDLDERRRQVAELSAAEEQVGRRLQGLAFVALELAAADTVEELTDLVVVRGVAAMGCDGGGVAVRDDDDGVVRLTITDTRREGQRLRQEMPMTAHLPSVVSAIVPEPIYLGNRDEGYAWGDEMHLVYATSGCDAWASLPLLAEGRQLGSLTVSWVEPRVFTDGEKELLSAFAAQCAQALQRIQAREAEREATISSRLLSESLQRSLLTDPAQPEHLQLVARYLPATREAYVGGDWYDSFELSDGDTMLVIGDVAGHDRMATASMAQIRGVLRGVAHSLDGSPAQVLTGLDHALRDLDVDALATAVLARVERDAQLTVRGDQTSSIRLLRWSNAGHPPPIVLRPDGSGELLDSEPELLLGLMPATARTDHELLLEPGMTLLLYTDGLVERRGETLTHGLEWLRHRVEALSGLPLSSLCDSLLGELPTDAEDDVALLAIRCLTLDDSGEEIAKTRIERTFSVDPDGDERTAPARRQDVSLVLPPDHGAVRRARSFVEQHCRQAGYPEAVVETVVLLTSETVTNAFIHGRSEARLRLVMRPDRVRVEVGDDNSRHPQRAERQDDALDGRGLDILDLASSSWGVKDDIAGKIVWFEVLPRR
ncbi:SpoIIE family protein phosphatase [Angustibacter sp. McL0619]|uniref:ATP-binding SpoIIE family protein phosphatase n=1 Tax=Angustibacter sp. McL0619 TaxID=3415676 RepID=UPI003CE998BE